MPDTSNLAIIIVARNETRNLDNLFASLARFAPNAQVVVVDNGSTDGTGDAVERLCPKAHLIRSPHNLGFSAGNNLAAKHVDRPFLLLLNADTVLLDPIDPALELLHNSPQTGVVGIRMLGRDLEYRHSCGLFPWPHRLHRFAGLYRRDGAFRDGAFPPGAPPVRVDWVEGSCLLTRTELWHKLGGLDEGYFMYVDDVDYCKRAADAGFATHFLPSLAYQHLGGYSPASQVYIIKGFRRFNALNAGVAGLLAATLVLDARLLARLALSSLLAMAGKPGHATKAKSCLHALLNR